MSKKPKQSGPYPRGDRPYLQRSQYLFVWDEQPPRPPKKGEWYLSGAIPEAYLAYSDLDDDRFILIPEKGRS